jgi:hypothetical protein
VADRYSNQEFGSLGEIPGPNELDQVIGPGPGFTAEVREMMRVSAPYLRGRNIKAGDGCETVKLKSAAVGQMQA